MLLGSIFVDWRIDVGRVRGRRGLDGVVQEVLKFFIVVLLQPKPFGRVNDIAQIFDEFVTFRAQLFAWVSKHIGFNSAGKSDINLFVGWEFS